MNQVCINLTSMTQKSRCQVFLFQLSVMGNVQSLYFTSREILPVFISAMNTSSGYDKNSQKRITNALPLFESTQQQLIEQLAPLNNSGRSVQSPGNLKLLSCKLVSISRLNRITDGQYKCVKDRQYRHRNQHYMVTVSFTQNFYLTDNKYF